MSMLNLEGRTLKQLKDIAKTEGVNHNLPKAYLISAIYTRLGLKAVALQIYDSMVGKWTNHSFYPYHPSVQNAKATATMINSRIDRANQKAKLDNRPKAFGVINKMPMRIIDQKGVKIPATSRDQRLAKTNADYYNK